MQREYVPVKKFTTEITQEADIIDLTDTKRWGDMVAGGFLQNTGTSDVVIDQTYTLTPGQSLTLSIGYPYIDKSSYRVNFSSGGRGTGLINSLGVTLYRIFPNAGNSK